MLAQPRFEKRATAIPSATPRPSYVWTLPPGKFRLKSAVASA